MFQSLTGTKKSPTFRSMLPQQQNQECIPSQKIGEEQDQHNRKARTHFIQSLPKTCLYDLGAP